VAGAHALFCHRPHPSNQTRAKTVEKKQELLGYYGSKAMNQTTMSYKGYTATIEWDSEGDCFDGEIVNLDNPQHIITFEGPTIPKMEEEFRGMVDWYLESCKKDGIEPAKPVTEVVAQTV
jgi:hypothetical protein